MVLGLEGIAVRRVVEAGAGAGAGAGAYMKSGCLVRLKGFLSFPKHLSATDPAND